MQIIENCLIVSSEFFSKIMPKFESVWLDFLLYFYLFVHINTLAGEGTTHLVSASDHSLDN